VSTAHLNTGLLPRLLTTIVSSTVSISAGVRVAILPEEVSTLVGGERTDE
jgi:hypothetical protein